MAGQSWRLKRPLSQAIRFAARMPVLRQDACLYGLAAAFALGVAGLAVTADYRDWAEVALIPYLTAAVISEVVHELRKRSPRHAARHRSSRRSALDAGDHVSVFRRVLVLLVLALTVLVPLGLQITWRAESNQAVTNRHAALAQPEVAVIERAGDRFVHFEDPYLSHPKTVGVSPSNDNRTVNDSSYFPYLPGMVVFGLANAGAAPLELSDARVLLAGTTIVIVVLALFLVPAEERRRWRALQFLVVLPTGALPIVTGGDDLPVLALLLLGLVLMVRRRPVLAGVAMGLAGSLKWTAWPLIVLGLLCVRDEDGRRAIARYVAAVAALVVPIVGAGVALDPHAFMENVVMFPLGLTKVHSPAASPLLGQELVQAFPSYKQALTVALITAGILVVAYFLLRHPPWTPYAAAFFAGLALAFATVIAPATRFGYFIYPANMFVWAYLLHRPSALAKDFFTRSLEGPPGPQLASATW